MKTITVIALAGALLLGLEANSAEKEGGGGSKIAAEFATTGRAAIEILAKGDLTMDPKSIFESIRNTRLIPTDKICHKESVYGLEYCEDAHFDARNNLILFDQERWMKMNCKSKLVLASHEYLRAVGLEGEDYGYSGRFTSGKLARCDGSRMSAEEQFKCSQLHLLLDHDIRRFCAHLEE